MGKILNTTTKMTIERLKENTCMADTREEIIPISSDEHVVEQKGHAPSSLWHRFALGGIMLISLFMNFFQLGQNGFGNLYYAAGIRSMLDNWHNFFFVSYDPGGFVTIDKPPLGFWLQVGSAKLFGYTPFSVFLPQAIAGVLSVLLLYYLVRRHFGVIAGLLAALALALSPISVVTNRNITIDSTLALVLLVGAWAVMRAAETGRLRWLLLSAAMVGIGFNVKMLEAYLVVPAYGLLYLLAAPASIWKRIGHLALAVVVLLAISLSWVLAVDMTPAALRPYVGSSQNNSEISLALGYNGINRLIGQFGRGGRTGVPGGRPTFPGRLPPGVSGNAAQEPPAGFGGAFESGAPGPLRLFNEPLAGQIAWLLPIAILGAIALAWQRRPRLQEDRQQQSLVLWGTWLLTMGVFFSVASFFHQYYMTEMAPAIAALFGIGLVVMWQDYRRPGWRGWLLPIALVVTVAEQIHILTRYPAWGQRLIPLMVVLCAIAVVILVSARIAPRIRLKGPHSHYLVPAVGAGVLALMLAPTVWAAIPVIQNTTAQLPVAGPSQANGFGGNFAGGRDDNTGANQALVSYLLANQGNAKYLVATPSSMTADSIILATNRPVMALGGFGGSDPILTTDQLAALVSQGTVRFFLLGSFRDGGQPPPQFLQDIPEQFRDQIRDRFGGRGGFGGQQSALTSWVTQHCTVVPASKWQSSASSTQNRPGLAGASQLYDCATTH
jgi:4-amino-4-deoxy-L-arabinose transferase-like glycosyltransferase